MTGCLHATCESAFVWNGQGLGEELALCFAEHGARLILSARNEQRLEVCCHGTSMPSPLPPALAACWLV